MEIDNILILRTLLLFIPYTLILLYFYYKVRDPFFLKPRTYIQLNILMLCLVVVFVETVYWHLSLRHYDFLGFGLSVSDQNQNTSNVILVLLGILAAVLGWLFTYRGQAVTTTRNHTIQTLIDSRLSEAYVKQVENATEIYTKFKKIKGESYKLEYVEFQDLEPKYKNAIFYLLNYLEFVAVGIRFGDLDENQMKNMMKSIIAANFTFFEEVIKNKQCTSPTVYEHLTALHRRWSCK